MLRPDVLVNPVQTALEDAEIILDGVRVDGAAPVFLLRMTYNAMIVKSILQSLVGFEIVRHYIRFLVALLGHDALETASGHPLDMERTDAALAFHKGEYLLFMGKSAGTFLLLSFISPEGLIDLDHSSPATKFRVKHWIGHGLSDSMGHKPCRLVGYMKHSV